MLSSKTFCLRSEKYLGGIAESSEHYIYRLHLCSFEVYQYILQGHSVVKGFRFKQWVFLVFALLPVLCFVAME